MRAVVRDASAQEQQSSAQDGTGHHRDPGDVENGPAEGGHAGADLALGGQHADQELLHLLCLRAVAAVQEVQGVLEDDQVVDQPQDDPVPADAEDHQEVGLHQATPPQAKTAPDGHHRGLGEDESPSVVARQRAEKGRGARQGEVAQRRGAHPAGQVIDRADCAGDHHHLVQRRGLHVEQVEIGDPHRQGRPGGASAAGHLLGEAEDPHCRVHERGGAHDGAGETGVPEPVDGGERCHEQLRKRQPHAPHLGQPGRQSVRDTPGDVEVRRRIVVQRRPAVGERHQHRQQRGRPQPPGPPLPASRCARPRDARAARRPRRRPGKTRATQAVRRAHALTCVEHGGAERSDRMGRHRQARRGCSRRGWRA